MIAPIEHMPPTDPDAECCVLGSCLMDAEALLKIRSRLRVSDFHVQHHRWIYAAMLDMDDRGMALDFGTLASELQAREQYAEIGGVTRLSEIVGYVPTAVHVEHYARLVEGCAVRRDTIKAAGKIAGWAYDRENQLEEMLAQCLTELTLVQSRAVGAKIHTPKERAERLRQMATRIVEGEPGGLPTGLRDLDRLIGGFKPGRMYILASRPGMGKTSLQHSIARNLAGRKKRMLFCSAEMLDEELLERDASALLRREWSQIEAELRDAASRQATFNELEEASQAIEAMQLYTMDKADDPTGGIMTVADVRGAAVGMKARGGLDGIMVDYLQLLQDDKGENLNAQVQRISRGLKGIAKSLRVPVLVASQLSRKVEERPTDQRRPELADLRDSGAIEQDADVVLMLYREDYYRDLEKAVPAELIVRKHRGGKANVTVPLTWRPELCEYSDCYTRGQ